MENTDGHNGKLPRLWVALIPFVFLIIALFFIVKTFGADSLSGASQVALLLSTAVAVAISILFCGASWESLESSMASYLRSISSAILILLMIGAISGTWMLSGVVPTLMVYGMKILSPRIFLLSVCIICSLVSLLTGSSWTTIATIGVVFIGIGAAMGYSAGWTAGAIISGAYFGDKISPLSDTTVLASSVTETPLFTHIRYMLITTVPSIAIACLVFLIVSLNHDTGTGLRTGEFINSLESTFNVTPWLLVVPVVTAILIARKVPALITLFLSALVAGIAALIAQPDLIASIGGGGYGLRPFFKGFFLMLYGSTSVETGNAALNGLVETNGMTGMLNTVFLIMCAASFGGALKGGGMIDSITSSLSRHVSGRLPLVGSTVATGVFANLATSDQYLSIILTANVFKKLYEDSGYESRLLSRTTEDSVTVTSVLVPWNSCGMTQATVLKVPTLTYLPYCIFNIVSPLMSLAIAAIGYKIYRRTA